MYGISIIIIFPNISILLFVLQACQSRLMLLTGNLIILFFLTPNLESLLLYHFNILFYTSLLNIPSYLISKCLIFIFSNVIPQNSSRLNSPPYFLNYYCSFCYSVIRYDVILLATSICFVDRSRSCIRNSKFITIL